MASAGGAGKQYHYLLISFQGSKFDDTDWINERHETKKSGLSGGEIAGIVIGVLILVALIAFIAYAVVRGVPEPLRVSNISKNRFTLNSYVYA